jgi:DNA (cytosine-5)-methyltransferase 1
MNYLSVCSGIEAATVAWHDLGFNPVGFSEIEKFPSQLLQHHYPHVTNYGDMTNYKEWNLNESIGLLVGGTPCQSFSVAGLRKGLEDPRGNLMLTYLGIAEKFKPKWLLWENVPGVLSSNGGEDFACLLKGMAELGYGFAYRVFDAQHFGVPQRRRRVFVVGCLGDWRSAAKVLFESESLCRDITPSRKEKQETSYTFVPSIANCLQTTCHEWSRADGFNMITESVGAIDLQPISKTLTASYGTGGADLDIKPLVLEPKSYAIAENIIGRQAHNGGNGNGYSEEVMYTLNATGVHGIAYGFEPGITKREGNPSRFSKELSPTLRADMGDNQVAVAHGVAVDTYNGTIQGDVTATMTADMAGPTHSGPKVMQQMRVRRLTPMECERLQGFPDGYTHTPTSSDTTRYKALGNSMAVPVMRWIGKRISQL